jgi:predicted ABC-type exoprotein transport system permease subunit
MLRLAEARVDFEYRSLLIEENEIDLHLYFSRMTVYCWLSWGFLGLALLCFHFPIITSVLVGLALIFRILSWFSKRMFEFVFRSYNLALAIVECVIMQNHGISFR